MTVVLVVALVVALVAWSLITMHYLQSAPYMVHLAPTPWAGEAPVKVSVVVPARNEAHQIGACLESLMAQDYPNWELIVVDDRSEDGTLAIVQAAAARDPRVIPVSGEALPEGWMGKSWANHQGVARATGDYFLFTDADTWHHPQSLSTTMQLLKATRADAVTLLPFFICKTFWEKLIQPAVVFMIAATSPLDQLEDPERPEALFNGQYILIERGVYQKAGGHEAIRASVADDLSLSLKVKAAGGVIRYPIGVELMRVRMYTTLREIWNGWSKNMFAGARGNAGLAVAGLLLIVIMHVLPWFTLPWFAWQAASVGGWLPTLGVGLSGMVVALTLWSRATSLTIFAGLSPAWALLHPLAFTIIAAIFANSSWRGLTGLGPAWKGRTYPGLRH